MSLRLLYFRTTLLLLLALSLASCARSQDVQRAAAFAPRSAQPTFTAREIADAVHERVQLLRARHDLPEVAWSDTLGAVARRHSADMAARDYFSHITPEGLTPTERAARMSYVCRKTDGDMISTGVGENLFSTGLYSSVRTVTEGGETTRTYAWKRLDEIAHDVVDGWMGSPGHRANLLEPRYNREGIGVVVTDGDRVLVTQLFC